MAEEGWLESEFLCKNSAEHDEKIEFLRMKKTPFFDELKFAESGNGQSSYDLRENPKKTWRAGTRASPEDKVCKQCGKGFQSMKALCGHMACHSDKEKVNNNTGKDDSYWSSKNQKVLDSQSDTEAKEKRVITRLSKSRKCKKSAVDSPFVVANNGSSSVSEVDGQEQEELAKCLMMLSRDYGSKGGVDTVVESSDNNSVVLETKSSSIEWICKKGRVDGHVLNQCETVGMEKNELKKLGVSSLDGENTKVEDSDSGYFLDECGKTESDVSVDWFRKNGLCLKLIKNSANESHNDGTPSKCYRIESSKRKYSYANQESWNESARMVKCGEKRSKYECFNCGKIFKSYQALGGHRPCHKRISASCESRGESGENSPDNAADYRTNTKFLESSSKRSPSGKDSAQLAEKQSKNKKNKAHVCPFCDRVFKNGQALGGHKRSHFLTRHNGRSTIHHTTPIEKPNLLDLNLPAPEADEDEGGGKFLPW